ncbi:MAG: CNNM domain-containing protein [Bdellovibrionales bacterium]
MTTNLIVVCIAKDYDLFMLELAFYIFLSIFVSFLCSILEACLLSVPKSYITSLMQSGHKQAEVLNNLKENVNRPLAAILSLNTVSHTVGAAGVGAKVLELFGDEWFAAASAILTLSILFFTEIIPKTIGTLYCKPLSHFAAVVIPVLIKMTYPLVYVSEKIQSLIIFGEEEDKITREEMLATTQIGESDGAIKENEGLIIKNLLNMNETAVQNIMTPLNDVLMYEQNLKIRDVLESAPVIRYSRIPVYNDSKNNIVGVILRYQVLKAQVQADIDQNLEKLLNPVRSVSKNISVTNALQQFIKHREHIFIVLNEYGSPVGIVTLEDAIEALLGEEILDEFDHDETDQDFVLEHDSRTNKFIIKREQE